jgi:uncharacterized integral membrane protein
VYEQRTDRSSGRSGISPSLIILIVLGILAVVFILQNSERSEVNFLMLDFSAPKWLTFVLAIALGVALDRVFQFWWRRRSRRPLPPPPPG